MQADDVGVFLVEKGEERESVGVARGRVVVVASGEAVAVESHDAENIVARGFLDVATDLKEEGDEGEPCDDGGDRDEKFPARETEPDDDKDDIGKQEDDVGVAEDGNGDTSGGFDRACESGKDKCDRSKKVDY